MRKPPSRSEQVLLRFNRTDFRVAVMRSICWRILYEKRACPQRYVKTLYRRALLTTDGKLTDLGRCYATRHNDAFYAMQPETKIVSEETKAKIKATKLRKQQANKG
jgi:hypothetical protein